MKSVKRETSNLRRFECPIDGFQQIISGKYKIRILWDLKDGPRRYGEIRQGLLTGASGSKEITPRVLSRELKELTGLGLLDRKDFKVVPPKVEYSLTTEAQTLIPVIGAMTKWGVQHLVTDKALRKLGIVSE
jgi:DNA-binding HxlR family transcriptional regulator